MIRAIIFDFDGLILETEEASFKAWQEVYRSFGHMLPFSTWIVMVGTTRSEFDPRKELQNLVRGPMDWELIEAQRLAHENRLIEGQPVLPGAAEYILGAKSLGLKTGIASNSSSKWVRGHLTRIGLVSYFDCICTADDSRQLKPDPDVYLRVLQGLGVNADQAFALEDSPIGIRSAKGAGLFCVAIPNIVTSQLDLSQADYQLASLAEIPLEELVRKVEAVKTQRAAS